MAVVTQRRRTLHNPPKAGTKRRKLSPKQIKFFGTPAQKAALKRHRAAQRPTSAAPRRRAGKKNSGEIVRAALANASKSNPSKRRSNVAKTRKRARRSASASSTKPRRRRSAARTNPAPHRRRKSSSGRAQHRRRARRNPSIVRSTGGFIANAAYMIAGAVGSKAGTQAILGSNNTGFLGYGANIAAAFLIGKVIGMFTKNKQAENSAILGGVAQAVLRFLIDQTPYGSKLKSAGFGDYQFQSFVLPQRLRDGANSAAVDIPSAWRPAPQIMPQAVAAASNNSGVSGLTSGRGLYGRR